jgi:hypothetical protein
LSEEQGKILKLIAHGKEIRINDDALSMRYKLPDGDIVQVAGLKMHFYFKS